MDKKHLLVNPTLACANLLNYEKDLDILKTVDNKILHIDVMDGHYVPNICFDLNTIRAIKENYDFLIDVHLMVTNPDDYIEQLHHIGVDYVSFHIDATSFSIRLLKKIRSLGMKAGIVLNPSQPVSSLNQVLPYVDFVLVMGVEPGFSGQEFIPETTHKIKELMVIKTENQMEFMIEVDGGIDEINGVKCVNAGADILVSGAFGVFQNKNGLKEDYLAFRDIVWKD